jgi:hypothetical protein
MMILIENMYKTAEMSESRNLKLNEAKCEEVIFYHNNIKHQGILTALKQDLTINGRGIKKSENVKYIGVLMSKQMNWTAHVSRIVMKVNCLIKGLARIIPYVSVDKRLLIFKQIIIPNILYASEVWGAAILKKDQKKIKRLLTLFSTVSSIESSKLKEIFSIQ